MSLGSYFRPQNGIQWLTLALVPIMVAGFIVAFSSIRAEQAHQNDALRSVICLAENFVRHSHHLSPEQKRQSLAFYNHALENAHLGVCTNP